MDFVSLISLCSCQAGLKYAASLGGLAQPSFSSAVVPDNLYQH